MRKLPLVVASALALSCAGSKPAPDQAAAAISKQSAEIEEKDQSLSGVQAVVRLVLKNDGSSPTSATRARYELVMDGKVFHTGEASLAIRIEPGSTGTVEIPVPFLYGPNEERIVALDARKEPIDYAVRGTVELGAQNVEFARASALRAPRLPKVRLESLETLKNEGDGGLTINASLEVENPNPFPVQAKGLRWKLSLGEKDAGEGLVARGATLKPASQTTYELSLALDPSDLRAKGIAIDAAALGYALEGVLELEGISIELSDTGETRLLRAGD